MQRVDVFGFHRLQRHRPERRKDVVVDCGPVRLGRTGLSPHALGASFSRSSLRRIAAFIASSEKKASWHSTSRMRD